MLHRMQLNGRVHNVKKLKSNLKEDNWIQAKGNFRRKSYSRKDLEVIHRCKPGERPWDTILVDGHGPMNIPTVQGFVIGYYFRSRQGGAAIVKGCSTHDQYPWLLEQVIIQVRERERGFKPIRILCDNEGSFISATALKCYNAYEIQPIFIPPKSPQSGGL